MSKIEDRGNVEATIVQDVAVIRLRRPEKLNAVTRPMLTRLTELLDGHGDGSEVRGVVLTGEGRAFSAGHDLSTANQAATSDEVRASTEAFHEVTRACLRTKVPVIAALNGIAVGGAFEMTLACDRRIGGPEAELYLPENSLGLVVSNASSLLLSGMLRRSAATDFVLGSRRYSAEVALELGLIDELVERDPVAAAIDRIHEYTSQNASTAQHLALFRPPMELIEQAMKRESRAAVEAFDAGVTSKGTAAFWERAKSAAG